MHFYTTAGTWGYVEHPEDLQTAGSYLYEPAGSIHTFETKEGAEGFMIVEGANVNLNDDGSLMFIMDAAWIEQGRGHQGQRAETASLHQAGRHRLQREVIRALRGPVSELADRRGFR